MNNPPDFSIDTVRNIILSYNPNTASGPDGIPIIFLKNLCDALTPVLANLFELSFYEGFVPLVWKIAFVTPIFKNGDRNLVENYRPISITSIVSRIFEKVLRFYLVEFMKKNGLFHADQHGFTPGRSCLTNLLFTYNYVTMCLDKGKGIDIVYLDLSKAFDKVNHRILIERLRSYGLNSFFLKWLECVLEGREHKVVLRCNVSRSVAVLSGVPQGSVLSPLFFLLYVNDFLSLKSVSMKTAYADDLKFFALSSDHEFIQQDLNSFSKWTAENCLNINRKKSKVIHFGKNNASCDYYIFNDKLDNVDEINDLGVLIDHKLSFRNHCDKICKKAYASMNILLKSFLSRDPALLIRLFKSYGIPIAEYCSSLWSPSYVKYIDQVEGIQRKFTKRISVSRDISYPERLAVRGLASLEIRRIKSDMKLVFRLLTSRLECTSLLPAYDSSLVKRSRCDAFSLCRFSTERKRSFFSLRAPTVWNSRKLDFPLSASFA